MSDAERAKNYRDRKRNSDGTVTIGAVPDLGSEPGPLLAAVEESLKSIRAADPVLAELARRLAAHLDGSSGLNHQVAAELRRTMAELRGGKARTGAGSGLNGGRQRVNKVAQLRGDYQSARSKRSAS